MKNLIISAVALFTLSGCDFFVQLFGALDEICSPERIEVTTIADPDIGDAVCRADGPCPLRAAMNTANFCGGEKTIVLEGQSTYLAEQNHPVSFIYTA